MSAPSWRLRRQLPQIAPHKPRRWRHHHEVQHSPYCDCDEPSIAAIGGMWGPDVVACTLCGKPPKPGARS